MKKQISLTLLFLFVTLFAMGQTRYFKGNSTYSGHILYTLDGKHIYRGNSNYSGNIISTLSGAIPIPILLLLL